MIVPIRTVFGTMAVLVGSVAAVIELWNFAGVFIGIWKALHYFCLFQLIVQHDIFCLNCPFMCKKCNSVRKKHNSVNFDRVGLET